MYDIIIVLYSNSYDCSIVAPIIYSVCVYCFTLMYIFCSATREFNACTHLPNEATTISLSQGRTKVSLVSLGVGSNFFFQNENSGAGYKISFRDNEFKYSQN